MTTLTIELSAPEMERRMAGVLNSHIGSMQGDRVKRTRRQYAKAWKAWRVACAIRARHRGRVPVKRWYDECRIMLQRAERAHRRALSHAD